MIYVVATPIGNLEDITLRALSVLKDVKYILCEDTRVTKKLLDRYEINNKKLISYHQHSKQKKVDSLIELIKDNDVALVTDAGTPGISDPGNMLIRDLVNSENLDIIPIPGTSAVTTALSISGLPTDNFIFLGFIPHKKGKQKMLKEIWKEKKTTVFYESKHRIVKTLNILKEFRTKDKKFVVCRELTKKFETIYRGDIEEVLGQVENDKVKGEYVVVVGV
ncbi:MAG: 16S rRNA (cytidine(1402)-2'-O)-methyltransferase [Patescibacteria group bacterium]